MDYGLHDSPDEALQEARTEVARYKAERDIARQELDRLREAGDGADGDAPNEQRMPQEDEEAARWVREQGGLDAVKQFIIDTDPTLHDCWETIETDAANMFEDERSTHLVKNLVVRCERLAGSMQRWESGKLDWGRSMMNDER